MKMTSVSVVPSSLRTGESLAKPRASRASSLYAGMMIEVVIVMMLTGAQLR